MTAAEQLLQAATPSADIPGAVLTTGDRHGTTATWVWGLADTTPGAKREMTAGRTFDLASLTKVVCTTVLVLGLVADGRVRLSDPIGDRLPGAAGDNPGVTLQRLLTHTSGLPATVKSWTSHADADGAWRAIREIRPVDEPGTSVRYSDVGFMLLGQLVEAVLGTPVDEAFRRRVAVPLGLSSTGFRPSGPVSSFAATERRPDGTPWVGVVHDENARFLGGVAGHAGLFATAADLSRFATWWVGEGDGPVPAVLRRRAERCWTEDTTGGRRGLGWVCRGDSFDFLQGWPASAVCHTGFTGTSIALDPVSGRWVVLLTNAVHHSRAKEPIKALRRELHAVLAPPGTGNPPRPGD